MEKVQSSPCILALPKQHPLTAKQTIDIQDLKNEPIITLSKETWPTLYLEFVNYCEQAGFKPKIVQEATEYQMVIGLVSAGIGVTFVPSSAKSCLISKSPTAALIRRSSLPNGSLPTARIIKIRS